MLCRYSLHHVRVPLVVFPTGRSHSHENKQRERVCTHSCGGICAKVPMDSCRGFFDPFKQVIAKISSQVEELREEVFTLDARLTEWHNDPVFGKMSSQLQELTEEVSTLSSRITAIQNEQLRGNCNLPPDLDFADCISPRSVDDRVAKLERDLAVLTRSLEEKVPFQMSREDRENTSKEEDVSFVGMNESSTSQNQESGVMSHSTSTKPARTSISKSGQRLLTKIKRTPSAYTFPESVWFAAAWIGFTSRHDAFSLSFIYLLNMVIQLYFCILIHVNLGNLGDMGLADSDLEGFMFWRFTSAHNINDYDAITHTSLATRVCDNWPGITASYNQLQHVMAFGSYIGEGTFSDVALGGPGLAFLCVMCWVSWVSVDVLDNLDFMIAVVSNRRKETHDC